MKDWTGNKKSTFVTLGASSHSDLERQEHDYYATDPVATELLMGIESLSSKIVDNSYGAGHLMQPLINKGHTIIGYDIVDRRLENDTCEFHLQDWLKVDNIPEEADIVCNVPYKFATEFVEHSIKLLGDGRKLCALLRVQFLEGKKRKKFFEKYPPKTVWVSSSRISCYIDGDFSKKMSSATCYCWFVWEKNYEGLTQIKWFN